MLGETQTRYPISGFKRSQDVTLECFLISALTKCKLRDFVTDSASLGVEDNANQYL